ncbi:MAG: preprotein translocase subunit SecG [Gammaproteobacteria bacterium]|nr:preprotein translocase subunit SecG [Gammaproteobacteria bacterium]
MYTVLQIAQLVLAIVLIGLVLIQQGKGATAGAGFGGGGGASGTVFGARGSAGFLTRLTGILAAVFFALCIAMAWFVNAEKKGSGSVLDQIEAPAVEQNSVIPSAEPLTQPAVSDVPAADGQ